ncbi:MAG: YggT family protein [Clostridium sp.]|uniref:YggT family protein n=1 Tax=Clostridium sp. DSM 8431 TaxID=1761781 RepID=UPI0008E9C48D|nr:YggT family protein [Clostridium sp. DSM 8431]MCR4943382.1 YggT family protein [Clostridium sp.]SFU28514.1 YggT family protein [Clostridium sp. DSM 8431]
MGLIPRLISSLVNVVEFLIMIECLLSWVLPGSNEIMSIIRTITNPILEPFRQLQYKFLGNIPVDISPIFAFMALELVRRLIYVLL